MQALLAGLVSLAMLTACGVSGSSTAASPAASSPASGTSGSSAAASDAAWPEDVQEIVDRGVLRVGVKNAVPGFGYQDPLTSEYSGMEIDLANLIAEHLGVDVEFTTVTAATRGELLDSGDIDCVLATFTITDERKETWDFTTPYYTDAVTVLVEDSSGITGLADLIGRTVGVSSGSTSARELVRAMVEQGLVSGDNFDPDTFDATTWTEGVSFHQYDDYPHHFHRPERRRSGRLLRGPLHPGHLQDRGPLLHPGCVRAPGVRHRHHQGLGPVRSLRGAGDHLAVRRHHRRPDRRIRPVNALLRRAPA